MFSKTQPRRLRLQSLEKRMLLAADLLSENSTPVDSTGDQLWSPTGKLQVALEYGQRVNDLTPLRPEEYKLFLFDNDTFTQISDKNGDLSFEVTVPTPTGELQSFTVNTTQILAPELAAKYPEIRTYSGTASDGSSDTVWLDRTPHGFHAQVFSNDGDYFVDPFFIGENTLHASYARDGEFEVPDWVPSHAHDHDEDGHGHDEDDHDHDEDDHDHDEDDNDHDEDDHDHDEDDHDHDHDHEYETSSESSGGAIANRGGEGSGDNEDNEDDGPAETQSGTQLRTYRLAVAATGEYTAFHGGTVADGLAAVVTAVNRVSGIYTTELSIDFELVANNDTLIYTNAATDPYTNLDDIAMLTENQNNLDNPSVLGNPNYDIGHVFSTSGGGVASLGSVGINARKAQGTTGLPNPIGDQFYVDFVAHEIGHQFGGSHTFNGDSANCSGGNRSGASAFEPGSGTTIQAYAGICGNDNIQSNSDPYFHFRSLEQIVAHVDNVIPSVGTRTATGNAIPSVDGGIDYTIPAQTPFELTAVGTDANAGDTLTYGWEQRDLGPQQDVNGGDNGTSPIFRSFTPTEDPTRVFPRLSDLLDNTISIGETLPTTNRDLNFRVTVRDNQATGGAISDDDVRITVVNTGTAFAVTSPNTAVSWPAFSNQTITWAVAGTTGNGIDTPNVDILLSTDGGLTYTETLASAVPNDGSHGVTIPGTQTTTARIKVIGSGNVFFDISNTNFSITESVDPFDFGDAPESYATLSADDGARHAATSLSLGALIDTEPNGLASADADGEGADDDGVRLTNPLIAGTTAEFQVTASAAGVVNYFADFNGDGVFQTDGTENFTANVVAGAQSVSLAIPADSTDDLYTRFRLSTAGGLGPGGLAADGEVEDYLFKVYDELPLMDFGDAPDAAYGTDLASDGPRHTLSDVFLGAGVTVESDSTNNATGTADSDDGIHFLSALSPGNSSDVEVTSTGGVLEYFFDFDADGAFSAEESFSTIVGTGTDVISVPVPITAVQGTTFGRFRLTTTGGYGPNGFADGGEVEDYQVSIRDVSGDVLVDDFDDANVFDPVWALTTTGANAWTVVTSGSDSAPNHAFIQNVSSVSDATLTSESFTIADGQQLKFRNLYNTENTFDGGVLEISIAGAAFQDILAAGGSFVTGGYSGTIDTRFGNPLSGRQAWTGDSSTYIDTIVNLPSAATGQSVQFRWRMGTDSSISDDGWHIDSITLESDGVAADFGDAPAGYPVTLANNGAAHATSSVFLGTNFDTESDGQASSSADGDDNGGTDDDDGVTFPASVSGGPTTISVFASETGILNAWIDTNDDGEWTDDGEQIVRDIALAAGANDIEIDVPELATAALRNLRFRFSTQSALATTGLAPDGEVEDYQLNILPPVPDVLDVTVNAQTPQRSLLTEIQIPFDTQISAPDSAFQVRHRESNTLVSNLIVTQSVVDNRTIATLSFGAGTNVETRENGLHSLADGNYQLELVATEISASIGGTPMTTDFIFGDVAEDNFFRLLGDADGNRANDIQDLSEFSTTFRRASADSEFNDIFDQDGDGDVDIQDLSEFGNRFRTVLNF